MAVVDIIPIPGLLTDKQSPCDLGWLKAHGYEWIAFQVVNEREPTGYIRDRDLGPAKAAGLSAGVWGVTYGVGDRPDSAVFFRDGRNLGLQAVKLGAEHVQMDAEMCAKFTRDSRALKPIIDGIRAGGWTGPVHLNTLGAPSNPKTASNPGGNDFGIDTKSFTDTGGGVIHQDYFNIAAEYRPRDCVAYWEACGVPRSRQNVMIDLANEGRTMRGADWAPLLDEARMGRAFSIFMAEFILPGDLEALDRFALRAPTPPAPNPAEINAKIAALAETWLSVFLPDEKLLTRLRNIKRIATTTDAEWVAVRQDVVDALDGRVRLLREQLATTKEWLTKVTAERDGLKVELAQAQADLAGAEARIATLTSERDAALAKIAAAKTALS